MRTVRALRDRRLTRRQLEPHGVDGDGDLDVDDIRQLEAGASDNLLRERLEVVTSGECSDGTGGYT
jgi:hypothetical protein